MVNKLVFKAISFRHMSYSSPTPHKGCFVVRDFSSRLSQDFQPISQNEDKRMWALQDLNLRPSHYECAALTN